MVEPDTTKTRQRNPTNFVGGIGGRGSGLLLCSLSMNDPPTTRLCEKSIKFLSQKIRASHSTRNAFFGLALCVLIPLFFDYRTIHRLFTQPLRWWDSGTRFGAPAL